jgi:hypothetical protein
MPLPDIKDYWSSEWITQINFGNVMSRVCFLQIFWMMHVGNDTTEESNQAIKRTKKVHGVIEYIEKQIQIYFNFMPLLHQLLSKTAHLVALQGFKIPSQLAVEIFPNAKTEKG